LLNQDIPPGFPDYYGEKGQKFIVQNFQKTLKHQKTNDSTIPDMGQPHESPSNLYLRVSDDNKDSPKLSICPEKISRNFIPKGLE